MLRLLYFLLKNSYKTKTIYFKRKKLRVLVADSFLKRAIGLMYREKLEEDGMLFVFKDYGKHAITMKNVKLSLDIFWLDRKGKIKQKIFAKPSISFYIPRNKSKFILELKHKRVKAKVGESFLLA